MRSIIPVAGVALLLVANGVVLWSFHSVLAEQRRAFGKLSSDVAALSQVFQAGPRGPQLPSGSPLFCSDRVDVLASVIADHLKGIVSPQAGAQAHAPAAATPELPPSDAPDDAPVTAAHTRAFDEAAHLVDDAIRSGTLTHDASMKLRQLKASVQRPQDFNELNLRIAAAINRGELSLPRGELTLP